MKDQIELPPLPAELRDVEPEARAYARAAVEPYAKRIAELEADRQRRGEPVAWRWRWKTDDSPLERRFADPDLYQWTYRNDRPEGDAAKLMVIEPLYAAPQPAEPAKVPSDEDIIQLFVDVSQKEEIGGPTLEVTMREAIEIARALLARYGQPAASAEPVNTHTDDDAVDQFAVVMKAKLAQARAKGRHGWHECDPADLSAMLREHVEKGDPRDVANFCMFLWSLGHPISAAPVTAQPVTARVAAATVSRKGYSMGTLLWTDAGRMADLPDGTMLYVGHSDRPIAAQPSADEDAYVIDRMSKLLAEITVIVRGPEVPRHRHGYADLPERVAALKAASVAAHPDHSEQDLNMVGQSSGNLEELPNAQPGVPHPYTDEMLVAAMEASVLGRPSVDDDSYVRSILDAARAAAPTPPAAGQEK